MQFTTFHNCSSPLFIFSAFLNSFLLHGINWICFFGGVCSVIRLCLATSPQWNVPDTLFLLSLAWICIRSAQGIQLFLIGANDLYRPQPGAQMLFQCLQSYLWQPFFFFFLNVIHNDSKLKPGFTCLHAALLLALILSQKKKGKVFWSSEWKV